MKLDDLLSTILNLSSQNPLLETDGPGKRIEWDSLAHVNIMTALENTYNISIDMDEVISIECVADIRSLLAAKCVANF